MGTRGAFGFHKNGVDKITYNHFDSYPTGLGNDVKSFIGRHSMNELNDVFDRIELIGDEPPTDKQIKECAKFTDITVSEQSTSDWYCLLKHAQGNLEAYADGLKYMEDNAAFLKDSLFCEWGYVINLTTSKLEIYRGFQKKPQDTRYKLDVSKNGYYNCALIREIPLSQVKNFDMAEFEKEIEVIEGDD